MTTAAARAAAAARVLDRLARDDRGRLVAALAVRLGDLGQAEDALHEAMAAAVTAWARDGLPRVPPAWLMATALRRGIDARRRTAAQRHRAAALAPLVDPEPPPPGPIPDHRLRLIFACCHPALDERSRLALTLRTVCGLDTRQIAAAFLEPDATTGQRLTRAKAKIAAARIPFAEPGPEDWADRLGTVLGVVRVIFTTGYAAGPVEGADLAAEALFLARLIDALKPGQAEVEGCLALILLTQARAAARVRDGATVPPAQQDRSLWDGAMLAEGRAVLARAMARRAPGPFQIRAAMADCQMAPGGPDWPQIAALAARLVGFEDTPVTRLNAAVALAEAGALAQGLAAIRALGPALSDYQPWHAALAEYLARTGDPGAPAAYDRALALARNPADAALLAARRAGLDRLTNRPESPGTAPDAPAAARPDAAPRCRDTAGPGGR